MALSSVDTADRLVSIGLDSIIRVWDIDSCKILQSVNTFDYDFGYPRLSYCFDYNSLASTRDATIHIWNMDSLGPLENTLTIQTVMKDIRSLCYVPDGSRVVCGDVDGTVACFSTLTGETLWSKPIHPHSRVYTLDVSFDGTLIVSSGDGPSICISFVESGEIRSSIGCEDLVPDITFNPNASKIAAACNGGHVRIWDVASCSQTSILGGHGSMVSSVSYSPDGTRLASSSTEIIIYDVDEDIGAILHTLKGYGSRCDIYALSFSSDGRYLASGGDSGEDEEIMIWNAITGQYIKKINACCILNVLLFLPPNSNYLLK